MDKDNENLSSKTLESTLQDQSVVYITKSGISITNSNLKKSSGDSSKTENSEFYGVNAAVLVQGGEATITGGIISTSAKGANAIVATNKGTVTISGTTIESTSSGSARGLHSTFGGSISASKVITYLIFKSVPSIEFTLNWLFLFTKKSLN